jgi:choline-phosphate cytidylyltransferase
MTDHEREASFGPVAFPPSQACDSSWIFKPTFRPAGLTMDTSSVSDDLSDYDVISEASHHSLDSSLADLGHVPGQTASEVYEPPPSQIAKDKFETVSLTAEEIRVFVSKFLELESLSNGKTNHLSRLSDRRTIRVYVDGLFDGFHAEHALRLRQAKLSFPVVYLMVGVFADELCQLYESPATLSHAERCEVVRHCRWVDEVVTDAPWVLDEQFALHHRIDYVALDEGTSVDPKCDKIRLGGYDSMKKLGKVIPTRRTIGLASTASLLPPDPTPAEAASYTPKRRSRNHFSVPEDFERYGVGF